MDAKTLFKRHFGHTPPWIVRAPGRLELLGNHTDYNEGLVLALAVDKYVTMAGARRTDGRIELVSSEFEGTEKVAISKLEPNPSAPWASYVKGVLAELQNRGVPIGGFNAAISGSIPVGAGLSSSAALEVATGLLVRQLYPFTLRSRGLKEPPQRDQKGQLPPLSLEEKLELAKLCQRAENNFVGVKCGLLDQISSLFGKAFHAIEIDFQSLSVEHLPMWGDIAIVSCNSGVKHQLVGGEYNELRRLCESAAAKLKLRSLRLADLKLLAANREKLTEREYQCACHVIGEIQRVVCAERALRDEDLVQFGQYMFQSHESSRDLFGNSIPELDLLVELAREQPGCLGARLSGGGWGGATINLVQRSTVERFEQEISQKYEQRSGHKLIPLRCQIVDGAA